LRIDKFEAAFDRLGVEFAGDFRRCRGVIDECCSLFDAGEGSIGTKGDRAQIMVVTDAGHDKILPLGGGFRRRRGAAAEFIGPLFRLGRGPVEHRHLVATFFRQMSRHRETHDAETEKSDFSHVYNLGVLPAVWVRPDSTLRTGDGLIRPSKQVLAADVEPDTIDPAP